jgi:hypothetical protein
MGLKGRTANGVARIQRSSWETRVAVGAPLLVAALALPIMFGAFSGASEGTNGSGTASYGPVVTTVPSATPTTAAATGASTGAATGASTGASTGAGTATAPVEANPTTAG